MDSSLTDRSFQLAAARFEILQAVQMLKGAAKLQLSELVVEDNERRRVVTRYVPIGRCVACAFMVEANTMKVSA